MIRRKKKYSYDQNKAPKSKVWLAFSEEKRIELIKAYHRKERIELESLPSHAAIHAAVENQAALGVKTPTKAAIKRLMLEGADRHEAIHAIGSVLSTKWWEAMNTDLYKDGATMNQAYEEAVRKLTLQQWYDDFGEE